MHLTNAIRNAQFSVAHFTVAQFTVYLPHYCGTGDFTRFISISHAVTGRFSPHVGKMTDADKVNEPTTFWKRSRTYPDPNPD